MWMYFLRHSVLGLEAWVTRAYLTFLPWESSHCVLSVLATQALAGRKD